MAVAGPNRNRRAAAWRRRPEDIALRSPWRRLTPVEVVGLALGAVCLGAVLALGGAVSPWLDFLSHIEPFYLPAGLALAVIAAVPARWSVPRLRPFLMLLGLAAAGTSLWLVAPDIVAGMAPTAPARPGGATLKILTQNAWEKNVEIGSTVQGILDSGADVVLLQELDASVRSLPQQLAKAYPYAADCTVITEWCSLAILSKRPILSWTHHEPAWRPPDWDRLALVEATIDAGPAGPTQIYTTHLMHPDGRAQSTQQVSQFLRAVGGMDTHRGVIGGDFNRPPWSFALRRVDAGIPVPRRTHGVFSWPNRLPWTDGRSRFAFPFLPLDQIYAGADWRVTAIGRAPSTGSDHYGVMATLTYEPKALAGR
jgi:endonuclease/exonuclease/phosphatase (EEP) superfamily protein YafD